MIRAPEYSGAQIKSKLCTFDRQIRLGDPAFCVSGPFLGLLLSLQPVIFHQVLQKHPDDHIRHILAHALPGPKTEAPVIVPELRRLVLQKALGVVAVSVCTPILSKLTLLSCDVVISSSSMVKQTNMGSSAQGKACFAYGSKPPDGGSTGNVLTRIHSAHSTRTSRR